MTLYAMQNLVNNREDLSRVKEILFGNELQEMEKRLGALRSELVNVIKNQVKTLEEKLDLQEKEFNEKISQLKKQIDGERLMNEEQNKTLQEAIEMIKNLEEQAVHRHDENRKALSSLKKELTETIRDLDLMKVDKTEIADLFGLMVQKLK